MSRKLIALLLPFITECSVAPKTPPPASVSKTADEEIQKLVEELGDEDQSVRQRATDELIRIGKPALVHVAQSAHSRDAEVAARSRLVISRVNRPDSYTIRLLDWKPANEAERRCGLEHAKTLQRKLSDDNGFPDAFICEISGKVVLCYGRFDRVDDDARNTLQRLRDAKYRTRDGQEKEIFKNASFEKW